MYTYIYKKIILFSYLNKKSISIYLLVYLFKYAN